MSTTRHEIMSPPAFHGPSKGHRTLRKCSAFPTVEPHLQINWFRGKTLLSRKDNSTQTFRRRHRVCLCYHQDPNPGSGILTWFPFDRWRKELHSFNTEFPYLLGSTNPCPIAVHMEPFSTSVFKVLIWIFATTTKISSIFRANSFGRWVVTHSLADFDFHDHRPAVKMNQHLLRSRWANSWTP